MTLIDTLVHRVSGSKLCLPTRVMDGSCIRLCLLRHAFSHFIDAYIHEEKDGKEQNYFLVSMDPRLTNHIVIPHERR